MRPEYTIPSTPAVLSILSGWVLALFLGWYSLDKPDLQAMTPVVSLGFAAALLFVTVPFFSEDARAAKGK